MADEENNNDDQLIQSLREFGENVEKITDKNRKILQKKLNHFLARRRMSEKLSQSVLVAKSPKGRGKRNSKQAKNVTLSDIEIPTRKEFLSSVNVVETKLDESKTSIVKRGRKSVVLNIAKDVIIESTKIVDISQRKEGSQMEAGSSAVESLKTDYYEPPQKKQAGSAVNVLKSKVDESKTLVVKRGRRNLVVGSAKDVVDNTETYDGREGEVAADSGVVESQNTRNALIKRRTYSCDKSDLNCSSKEQSLAASRIPKLAPSSKSMNQKLILSPVPTVVTTACSTSNPVVAKSLTGGSQKALSIPVDVHIIDSTIGKAAVNVNIELHFKNTAGVWMTINSGSTDTEGHGSFVASADHRSTGVYRLHIDSESYFKHNNQHCFYPFIEFIFNVSEVSSPVDIQVILSPFGYSAHRIR